MYIHYMTRLSLVQFSLASAYRIFCYWNIVFDSRPTDLTHAFSGTQLRRKTRTLCTNKMNKSWKLDFIGVQMCNKCVLCSGTSWLKPFVLVTTMQVPCCMESELIVELHIHHVTQCPKLKVMALSEVSVSYHMGVSLHG
jgi:hypothetical protein